MRVVSAAVAVLGLSVPIAPQGQAPPSLATRTWVSGVGDDVNACSRTQPCKTFAGAVSKTSSGGEINVLDAGGYSPIIITKSVTIDGTGLMASILAGGVPAIRINITDPADVAKTVRIRRLALNGAGRPSEPAAAVPGIVVMSARRVTIEETVIDGFTGDAVHVTAPGVQMFVGSSMVRNNGRAGIHVEASGAQVALSGVRLMFNGVGLRASAGNIVSFGDNILFGNTSDGVTPALLPKR